MDEELKLLLSIQDFTDSPGLIKTITCFIEEKLKEYPTEETLRSFLKTFPMKIDIKSELSDDYVVVDMIEYRKQKSHTAILATVTINMICKSSSTKTPEINSGSCILSKIT